MMAASILLPCHIIVVVIFKTQISLTWFLQIPTSRQLPSGQSKFGIGVLPAFFVNSFCRHFSLLTFYRSSARCDFQLSATFCFVSPATTYQLYNINPNRTTKVSHPPKLGVLVFIFEPSKTFSSLLPAPDNSKRSRLTDGINRLTPKGKKKSRKEKNKMATQLPQPSTRRTARERQQAVLRDCARRFPGLAPMFTVKQKTNFSITQSRAGLFAAGPALPPRFATLQHHLPFVVPGGGPTPMPVSQQPSGNQSNGSGNDNNSHHPYESYGVQHIFPAAAQVPLVAGAGAGNNNNGPPSATPAPSAAPATTTTTSTISPTPAPRVLLTIRPHAALTPEEVATHTLLRQISLLSHGHPQRGGTSSSSLPEEARRAQREKKAAKQKKKMMEKGGGDGDGAFSATVLGNVKSGRVEKKTTAKKVAVAVAMWKTAEEDDVEDGDEENGGACHDDDDDAGQGREEEEEEKDKELWG